MVKTLTLKVKNKEKDLVDAEKLVVLCKNLPKFIAHSMTEQELENCTIKIGIDSGQGSFEICLTLLEAHDDFMDLNVRLEHEKRSSESAILTPPLSKTPKKSPRKSKSSKPGSSVKQIFFVGICTGLPELYKNFRIFFGELGLRGLHYYPAANFQAINILLGLQGYSAKICCPYCVQPKPYDRKMHLKKGL